MFSNRLRSTRFPANAQKSLTILLLSIGVIFVFLTSPFGEPRGEETKLGPRLRSPLLPTIHREHTPVAIDFGHELSEAELSVLEGMELQFRQAGSTHLHSRNGIYVVTLPHTLLGNPEFLKYAKRVEYAGRTLKPQIDDSARKVNVPNAWSLVHETTPLTGQGSIIGVIDTGIDWKHPDFFFPDGPTANVRFGSDDGGHYADLNQDGGFQSSEDLEFLDEPFDGWDTTYNHRVDWLFQDKNGDNKFNFGSETMFLLRDSDGTNNVSVGDQVVGLSTSKIKQIWDQVDDCIYVRETNLTQPSINREVDGGGHGTHVAGILAGGQLGFDRRWVGVAPGAELLVVRTDYEEGNVIAAIQWLVAEGADVIVMSLGGTTGYYLDGSSLLERTVDDVGIPVVISGGNEGSYDRHAYTFLRSGMGTRRKLRFKVMPSADPGTASSTVYVSVLWRNEENPIRFYIQSPSSSMAELPGKDSIIRVGQNNVAFERSESDRGTQLMDIEITRTEAVEEGTWTLTVENQQDGTEVIHAWVETDPISLTKFLDFATDQYTITNPATADKAVAVVSFNHTSGELSYFSSQGPRIDGTQKPWIVAPGEQITAAHPVSDGTPGHSDLTGVSAAAPHIGGIIALMLQADPDATRADIYDRLAQGADKDIHTEGWAPTPNEMWGYGKVNAFRSVLLPAPQIRDVAVNDRLLENGSESSVFPGDAHVTFTFADPTVFLQNTTLQLEVRNTNATEPRQYEVIYKPEAQEWITAIHFTLGDTYQLTIMVQDPLFLSRFHANLTVVEPASSPTTSTPTPHPPEVPELGFPQLPTALTWKGIWVICGVWVVGIGAKCKGTVWRYRCQHKKSQKGGLLK